MFTTNHAVRLFIGLIAPTVLTAIIITLISTI